MTSIKSESNIIIKAKSFAKSAHAHIVLETASGDRRQHIEHLQEVADFVLVSGGSDIEIAAAWLHDSVEDTSTTLKDIEKSFGKEIAEIVSGLTDLDEIINLPTKDRKSKQAERVATESDSVKRIKIADQTSNLRLVTYDPKPTWPFEDNRDYAIGAKQIVDQCRGISPILDDFFDREYEKAQIFFKI